ncbi:hypothetical protein WR25_26219 [Diploscapter pachys]|uniref:ShKT domain-containing protein n=1 Tax=Diploscapter pachys TaxID=2018661 RepID=A0A2A2LR59_9BILA|nr:hypothetical protein WR25_26219 [Diploscapter pachys]
MPQYLSILVTVALFAGIGAQINDPLECTEVGTQGNLTGQLVYAPVATVCQNPMGDAGCKTLYGGGNDSAIAPGNNAPRPSPCFSTEPNGTTIDPSMKAGAIKNCPKFCGYCCKTPEYDCPNKNPPNFNCDSVTQAMCQDPAWRQPIAESCPNKCGMCQMGGCVDKAVDCAADTSICNNMNMQQFVNENCQRTCQRCPTSSTTGTATTQPGGGGVTPAPGSCSDSSTSCATWNTNGFCSSTFYTQADKAKYCAK